MNQNLSIEYLRFFSNFFNRSYIYDYINKKENKIIKDIKQSNHNTNIIELIGDSTYADFFNSLYNEMKLNYKNEYVYLNEIFINKILKKHGENHKVFTELSVNNSMADLVVVNGTTTAYEIKTELDSLARIDGQLLDYTRVFDKVYVITHRTLANKIKEYLSMSFPTVGIYVLNDSYRLKLIKGATSNKDSFDQELMFSMLNRNEFEELDEDYYIAKEKFMLFSTKKAHLFLKNKLYERRKDIQLVNHLPDSLKMIGYKIDARLNKTQKSKFISKLNNKISEDL